AGRTSEAFVEFRRACAEDSKKFRPQVFDLAWHIFNADVSQVLAGVGDTTETRAGLAEYLLKQQRLDDALRLWASFNAAQKQEQRATGEQLVQALLAAKRYHATLDIERDLHGQNNAPAEDGLL